MQFNEIQVINRLESLGYILKPGDNETLGFLIGKVESDILNFCNIDALPDAAVYIAIDMACGEFLLDKKAAGDLIINGIDLSKADVKSISEGDTSVSFDGNNQNAAQKADALINSLLASKNDLYKFRRLAW